MQDWKTLSRQVVLDLGPYLKVESRRVQIAEGKVIDDWAWLETPDYAIILAVRKDGRFLCFRQTKYAVEGLTLAPVGGYLEPGEQPLEAARRELLEETGYIAGQWVPLGSYAVDGNHGNGRAHLYLALDARQESEPHADDLEEQQLHFLTLQELRAALQAGEFKVLAWTTAVALSLLYFSQVAEET